MLPVSLAVSFSPASRPSARRCAINNVLAAELSAVLPDKDVICLPDGTYFNTRLHAPNAFEIAVDESIIEEAADIFYGRFDGRVSDSEGGPFDGICKRAVIYDDVLTPVGRFFTQRVSAWRSDLAWVAVDDEQSLEKFEDLFKRLELPQRFASIVPHHRSLKLYCAQYLLRSWCEGYNFHTDFNRAVGTNALTFIAPLRNYRETQSFQLTYKATVGEVTPDGHIALGTINAEKPREGCNLRRYEYRKGKAIVFGSGFEHSTEPGAGHDGEVHAYLSFMFGTDDQAQWPEIEQTMDAQSRILQHPDGRVELSKIGRAIQLMLADLDESRQSR